MQFLTDFNRLLCPARLGRYQPCVLWPDLVRSGPACIINEETFLQTKHKLATVVRLRFTLTVLIVQLLNYALMLDICELKHHHYFNFSGNLVVVVKNVI